MALKKPYVLEKIDTIESNLADKAKKIGANVLDYGAVGNQNVVYDSVNKVYTMTDSTTAFQNAIDSEYDIIIIPEGNYFINSQVNFTKPVLIIGYNARIYSSPNATTKRIFSLGASATGSEIRGVSFYSTNEYPSTLDVGASTLISNIIALDINGASNINVHYCYGEQLSFMVSCMNCSNIDLEHLKTSECYFPFFSGFSASNINIKYSHLKAITNADIYGHVLYLGYGSHYITIENCELEMPGSGSNIVKCGSSTNDGIADHIVLRNCKLTGVATTTVLYVHNGADISLYNCNLDFTSGVAGYSRLLQFNDNSKAYFKGCNITLDSFDKYTQNTSYVNNNIEFEDCKIKAKNTIVTYCWLPLVAGAKVFKFTNCILDWSENTYGGNILYTDVYSVELINCKLILTGGMNLGSYQSAGITYSRTNTPLFRAINCVFDKVTDATTLPFLGYIVNDVYIPKCQLINPTLINCDAKSGVNIGKYIYDGVNTQYTLSNIINIAK